MQSGSVSGAPRLSGKLLWTLTAATVLAVGNVYYCQPLLGEISGSFGRSAASAGTIPMSSQLGYVLGLFFLTPLGDVLEKRRLLVGMLLLSGAALLGAALAPTFPLFLVACLAIGLTAVLVQIIIPFVAVLSAPTDRGRNLGTVLSGALMGVLLARTLSGFIGEHLGWRGVYFFARGDDDRPRGDAANRTAAVRVGRPRSPTPGCFDRCGSCSAISPSCARSPSPAG